MRQHTKLVMAMALAMQGGQSWINDRVMSEKARRSEEESLRLIKAAEEKRAMRLKKHSHNRD